MFHRLAPVAATVAFARSLRILGSLLLLMLAASASALAQTSGTTSTAGTTPAGLSPGAPVGSYPLSGFDTVNAYNGNLNFRLPLLQIGGRGSAGTAVTLALDSKGWNVKRYPDLQDPNFFHFIPLPGGWSGLRPGYGPGVLQARGGGSGWDTSVPCSAGRFGEAVTRLTFTTSSGTEFELRDQINDGEPLPTVDCVLGTSRGTIFKTSDGTAASFIADSAIVDRAGPQEGSIWRLGLTGYLYLRDGTVFRIVDGLVDWQMDANGNRINYTYDANGRVTTIRDTLKNQVTITYTSTAVGYDTIAYSGAGGFAREIKVYHDYLSTALRVTQAGDQSTTQSYANLFPTLEGSSSTLFETIVTTKVELPGLYTYELFYNVFGELARVEVPTGGAYEYDYVQTSDGRSATGDGSIIRRLGERRAYTGTSTTTLERVVTYVQNAAVLDPTLGHLTTVIEDNLDASRAMMNRVEHRFYGNPAGPVSSSESYRPWKEGKEYRTLFYDASGVTVLRRIDQTWAQRTTPAWESDPVLQPEEDPRVTAVTTTAMDTTPNLATTTVYDYDAFNNVTEEYGYDSKAATAPGNGTLLRQVSRTFVTTNNGENYTSASITRPIHLRSLLKTEEIKNGSGVVETRTSYEYDVYSGANHAALVSRDFTALQAALTHATANYGTGWSARGNLTAVTLAANAAADSSTSFYQYDIAGNVVRKIDGQGTSVDIGFDPAYYYAYPTSTSMSVTGADGLADPFTTQTSYDVYRGQVTSATGFDGRTTTYQYTDPLDRLSDIVPPSPAGGAHYGYSSAGTVPAWVTATTTFDSSPATTLTSTARYDGLGRVVAKDRTDAGSGGTVTVATRYDGLGRPWLVTNPYRPNVSAPTDGWIRTLYDALGRAVKVSYFDNSPSNPPTATEASDTGDITTSYTQPPVNNRPVVLVTDQVGKQRMSVADGLGRLVQVTEPDLASVLNAVTTYVYDARGNLTTVNQGVGSASPQTRQFGYDARGLLRSGQMPECVGTTTYTYDDNSNLLTKLDPRGITSTLAYDEIDRVKSKTYTGTTAATATSNVKYVYDDSGLPSGVTAPTGWSTFDRGTIKGRLAAVLTMTNASTVETYSMWGYDLAGRAVRTRQMVDATAYDSSLQLNAGGAARKEFYPSGTVADLDYNSAGQLSTVKRTPSGQSLATLASGVAYSAAGSMTQQTLGSGLIHQVAYNSRLQPTQIQLGTVSLPADKLKLAYDYGIWSGSGTVPGILPGVNQNSGNVGRVTITPGTGTSAIEQYFQYDPLNRLLKAEENWSGSGTPAPSITSVTPSSGTVGTSVSVTIAGSNLTGATAVTVSGSGVTAAITGNTATSVTATLTIACGATTGARSLTVTTGGGTSNGLTFTVAAAAAPSISSLSPTSAAQGANFTLTITGSNLQCASAVTFTPATSITVSNIASTPTQVTCSVQIAAGAATGVRTVKVTTPSGTSGTLNFTVTASGCTSTITSLTPNTAQQGANFTLTIAGTNLSGATAVTFSPSTAITVSNISSTATQVTCSVSIALLANTGSRTVSVTTPCGTTATLPFTITLASNDYALGFSGSAFNVYAVGTGALAASSPMTVEAWIRPAHLNATNQKMVIVSKRQAGGSSGGGYELRLNDMNQVVFAVYDAAGMSLGTATSAGQISTINTWYHVSGSVTSGGALRAELSGTVSAPVAAAPPGTGTTRVQLGRAVPTMGSAGQDFFDGRIDEVRISSVVRYTANFTPSTSLTTDASTSALWKMTEGSGATAADSSSNAVVLNVSGVTTPWPGGVTSPSKRKRAARRTGQDVIDGAGAAAIAGAAGGDEESVGESWSNKTAAQSWTQGYTYDQYGNLTMSDGPAITISATTNKITTSGYVYDNCGNLTADANGRSYLYDAENRLWQVKQGTTVIATYVYDGEGNRVRKNVPAASPQTTRFVYGVGGSLIAEYTGTSSFALTKEYAYGPSGLLAAVDISGSTHTVNYLTPDHLGTPRVITNATGGVVSRHDYKPFGEEIGLLGGRTTAMKYATADTVNQRFTSKERDTESNLDYFGARYMASAQGRFTGIDQGKLDLADPQSLNRYHYCLNNPLKFVDPDGKEPSPAGDDKPTRATKGAIIGAAVGTVVGGVVGGGAGTFVEPGGGTVVGAWGGSEAGAWIGAGVGGFIGGVIGWATGDDTPTTTPSSPTDTAPPPTQAPTINTAPPPSQAQPVPPPPPIEKGRGSTKNARKINQGRKAAAQQAVDAARRELERLESVPNKTPEDKAARDAAERALNKALDTLKKSEEHARRGRGN